ncbi:MAG: Uma2 family endonuclease [Cyanobacteria bacterium P01_G01_bin.49]
MFVTVNQDTLTLSPGSEVILRQQTWEDYENLITIRQANTFPKLYFNSKTQEIRLMSPLPSHGKRIDTLRDLVKSLLRKQGKDWDCFDPITLKRLKQAGVEPDTCFYVENRQAILGKDKIDLAIDPPPDLAIEVDLTSINNIDAYEPLQIPELWIYKAQELNIYLFDGTNYQDSLNSLMFSDFDVKTILPKYIELAWNQGSSVALRQFEQNMAGG